MKNYYCLIVIGNVEGVEDTVSKVINGKFMHKNLGKLFISTFESDFSIWEIEQILHGDKRSYFLTKMQGSNFTATVQDIEMQNDLFLDYVSKIVNENDQNTNSTEIPKFDPFEPPKFDINRIKNFMDSIKNQDFDFKNPSFGRKNKRKKENMIPPTLDELLDKINKVGYQKLTKFEKKCLEDYSKK